MIDRDIWITANELIKRFGNGAAIHAAMRADALADEDDAEGYLVWRRVAAAIPELENAEPGRLVNWPHKRGSAGGGDAARAADQAKGL